MKILAAAELEIKYKVKNADGVLADAITKSKSEYEKIEENFSGYGIEKQVICVKKAKNSSKQIVKKQY